VTVANDDLASFLRAQWDAEEADARWSLENAPAAHQTDPNSMNFSPARVLAEVEAKRRILDKHAFVQTKAVGEGMRVVDVDVCRTCSNKHGVPCATVRLLALPYADHESYREGWKP
jgi:hypothetical protein